MFGPWLYCDSDTFQNRTFFEIIKKMFELEQNGFRYKER